MERNRLSEHTPPVFRSRRVVTPEGERPATVHVFDGTIRRVSEWDDVPRGAALAVTSRKAKAPSLKSLKSAICAALLPVIATLAALMTMMK